MVPLEDDEAEGKEITGIKSKSLTRLPVLLSRKKSSNNSYKLKTKMRQIMYLLYQHNKIARKLYNNLIKLLQQWERSLKKTSLK